MAVNVSTRQLLHTDMLRLVESVLEETALTPALLDLELSEHIAVKDLDLISPVLERLSRMGIRISMDDFGIGYSSLNRLKSLPISSLKIDQSFIRDMNSNTDNAALTAAIISMGHSLKLNTCEHAGGNDPGPGELHRKPFRYEGLTGSKGRRLRWRLGMGPVNGR